MAEELVSVPAAEQQAAPPPERRPRRPLWYRVKDFLPAISGVAAAISAACAVVSAYYAIQSRTFVQEQSQQQREQARQQRVARAWDVLNAHGHDSANAGQAEALETLHREGASLRQLNLAGCYLYGVKLPNADLELANFGQTDTWPPTRANLRKADLGRVKLRAAVLSGAELVEANLSGADLQGALLKEADLQGADLSGAELQGADLRSSKLSGAELGGTNFSNADTGYAHFEGNDFRGTLGLTKNQIQSAHTWILGHYSEAMLLELGMPPDHEDRLKNRDFTGLDISRADFTNAKNLTQFNFSKANLSGVALRHANLEGARFDQANLSRADLYGAKLQGARFDQANLSGAALAYANLEGARFDQANLSGATLIYASVRGIRFEGADISGAEFYNVKDLEQDSINDACADPSHSPKLPKDIQAPGACQK